MIEYVRLLRQHPDFARLWYAQVVSLLGDWFNTIALSVLVSQYTNGSGLAVSALLVARFLPPLIVSPFAGVLIDRFNRKRLLLLSDILRAVFVLVLLLFANGPHMLWLIYLLTVFQYSLSAIFEPGRSAVLPRVIPPSELLKANTLSNITWSVMLAVGGAVGGLVSAFFGTTTALVIDSATFALSAFFISQIRTNTQPMPAEVEGEHNSSEHPKSGGSFMDGLRFVRQNPAIAATLLVKLGLSLGSVDALMIVYATSLFVVGEDGTGSLGILYSAFGVGSIIGPLILNRFNNSTVRVMRRLMIVSFIWVTAGWLLFGLATNIWIAAMALIVRAMGGSATWTYSSTILQVSTPDTYLGRVFSIDWAGFYLAVTISTLVTGLVIDTLGSARAPDVSVITGAISIIPLVLWGIAVYWLERRDVAPAPTGDESGLSI